MNAETQTRRAEVGSTLYRKMLAAEESIQLAMEHSAEFAAALARAPREAELYLGYGQGVIARVARTSAFLADARGELVTAHAGLEKIQSQLGVTMDMEEFFGTPPDKEKPPSGLAEVVTLPGRVAA